MLGLVLAVALGACGGDDEVAVEDVPVVTAEGVPGGDAGLEPTDPATASPSPDAAAPGPDPTPSPTPTSSIGPSSADAASFVRGPALDDLAGVEHVVVDLDGDTWPEVVATGVRDGVGVLRVAWWTVDGYAVLAEGEAGPGRSVTDLRAADLTGDGRTELLVAVEGEGLHSLALWSVLRRGVIRALAAEGGCHDGQHVYGVTSARLEDSGQGPPTIVADCDDSPLPVADWSEQRWVWDGDAYRVDGAPEPDHTPVHADDEADAAGG